MVVWEASIGIWVNHSGIWVEKKALVVVWVVNIFCNVPN